MPVEIHQHGDRDRCCDDGTEQLTEARSHQVSDPLGVVHDAGDELAALCGVKIRDREPLDTLLDPLAHLGDGPLGGDAEHLGEGEAGNALDEGRNAYCHGDPFDQGVIPFREDFVADVFGRGREHHPGEAGDQHQDRAQGEAPAGVPDDLAGLGPCAGVVDLLLAFLWCHGKSRMDSAGGDVKSGGECSPWFLRTSCTRAGVVARATFARNDTKPMGMGFCLAPLFFLNPPVEKMVSRIR